MVAAGLISFLDRRGEEMMPFFGFWSIRKQFQFFPVVYSYLIRQEYLAQNVINRDALVKYLPHLYDSIWQEHGAPGSMRGRVGPAAGSLVAIACGSAIPFNYL